MTIIGSGASSWWSSRRHSPRGGDPEPALSEEDLEEATGEEIEAYEERLVDRATAAQTIVELKAEIAE